MRIYVCVMTEVIETRKDLPIGLFGLRVSHGLHLGHYIGKLARIDKISRTVLHYRDLGRPSISDRII